MAEYGSEGLGHSGGPGDICEASRPREVRILSSQRVYDGYFKIDEARIRLERFSGELSDSLTRYSFERGDSVAVLPYDARERSVVLVQQFRYPAFVRGGPGWLWETIAGTLDQDEDPADAVRREALEEAGYRLGPPEQVMIVYPSPGGSSERMYLYLAPASAMDRLAAGCGAVAPGEDILVREFSLGEAMAMVGDGRIVDAKTILLLQHLAGLWRDQAPSRSGTTSTTRNPGPGGRE